MGTVIGSKSPFSLCTRIASFNGMIISRATKLRLAGCVEPQSSNFVRGLPFPAAVAAALSACRPSGCRGFFFFFSPSPKDARRFSKRLAEPPPPRLFRHPPLRGRSRPTPPVSPSRVPHPWPSPRACARAKPSPRARLRAAAPGARAHDPGDALIVGRVVPVVPGKHAEHLLLRSLPFRAFIVGVVVVVVGVGKITQQGGGLLLSRTRPDVTGVAGVAGGFLASRASRIFVARGARPSRRCVRRRSPP